MTTPHRTSKAWFWVLVVLSVLPATAAAQIIQPGDELLITIPDPKPKERTVQVDEDGQISLGSYGRLKLAGLTVKEARIALRKHLGKYLVNTGLISLVLSENKQLVLVSGQVNKPGLVRVGRTEDLWQAIQKAGGLMQGADLTRVVLVRQGKDTIVDIRAFLTRERKDPLPALIAGDTLFVPADPAMPTVQNGRTTFLGEKALTNKIFVLGAVRNPGLYDRSPDLTPLTAIGLAGGPSQNADLAGVRLLTPEKSDLVNLTSLMMGGVAPVVPIPATGGAIIFVPERRSGEENPFGQQVNVMGGVTRPGRVSVSGPTRLVDAIGIAGGPTERGDLGEVKLVKTGEGFTLTTEYDVDDFLDQGGIVGEVTVEAGDSILVGQRRADVFENVLRGLSDLTIIAAAVLFVVGASGSGN